jgi:hypothetical protein
VSKQILRVVFAFSFLVVLSINAFAATTPASGTVSPSSPTVSFTGGPFSINNPVPAGEAHPVCTDQNCGIYALTVQIPATDFNTYKARVSVGWVNNGATLTGGTESDFDIYAYSGDFATGTRRSAAASLDNPEVMVFDVTPGTYTIYVEAFDVSPTVTFSATVTLINAAAAAQPWPIARPNPAFPPGTPRFYNYHAPNGVADDAGEPSIGVNWKTEKVFGGVGNGGTVHYFGGFLPYMLRTTFDDRTNPAAVTWEQAPLVVATAPRVYGDPILFTDPKTGRVFVSQELGLTPLGSTMEWSDNDGLSWTPSEGSGAPSGIDHQTVGGGPFHAPIPTGANPNLYPHGVWYCSQSIADAVCSISLDGGITFGPAVPMYSIADCSGLHGHIKIGPDGTAYVPTRGCGGALPYHTGPDAWHGLVVSEDNGITWKIRRVQIPGSAITGSTMTDRDPSVAIASDGTVYYAYQAANGHSRVAVSRDKGLTWINDSDVGAAMGVENSLFHAAVAGDGDRAAVAFFGTETAGANYDQPDFPGVWYLYIATTLDRGQTWTVQNASPGDPVQRGGICGSGGCRNLLDFFGADIDKRGRVLVGYDDGCISATCISGVRSYGMLAQNDFTAKAVIARQASGKRLFAAYDNEAGADVNPQGPGPFPPHPTSCDGNVATDPAGDPLHPLLGANGGNMDGVDITGLKFSVNGDKLVTSLTLKNLSLTPVNGTLGTFYYVTWTAARRNADGSTATRTFATRMSTNITGAVSYSFGQYDQVNDAFIGTATTVTGSHTLGPNGTINVEVPLGLLGNPTIPVTDATSLPAVIEPYAVTILHEQQVRFVQPADRAPNAGANGAHWAVCLAPVVTCFEESDASIAYTDGWHTLSSANASGGKFAFHTGGSPNHKASFSLNVTGGNGKITYYYATSPKGGSAELFLDGVSKGVVSYAGNSGSTKDPVFGASIDINGVGAGAHTLELRNMSGTVYVDRFCLSSASTSGSASSGPGQTSTSSSAINAGQQALSQLTVPANAESVSVVAESSLGAVQLVLVDPSGLSLATSQSANGIASLSVPVTQGGAYLVKVVNLNLGPVNVWTAATPRVTR